MYEKSENKCGDNSHKYLLLTEFRSPQSKLWISEGYFAEYALFASG